MMKLNMPIVTETELTESLILAGKEIEKLRAENERLRAELGVIANWANIEPISAERARLALKGET